MDRCDAMKEEYKNLLLNNILEPKPNQIILRYDENSMSVQ